VRIALTVDIEEETDVARIYMFLAKYPELSFPCRKIRKELTKMDGIPRNSAMTEYSLRKLAEKELIERTGIPGHYEYKIRKNLKVIEE